MNRSAKRIGAALAVCWLAAATTALAGGFRGNEWGAVKSEVKAREKYTLHHDRPGELAYFAFELAGVEAGLIYEFEDDRLVSAYFTSRHRTADPEEDYADYKAWQARFDEHYGKHTRQEWVWRDGAEAGEENLAAVSSGRAELVTHWTLDDARVRLVMQGEDGAIQTIRAYHEPPP